MPPEDVASTAGQIAASTVAAAINEMRNLFMQQFMSRMDRMDAKLDKVLEHGQWVEKTLADHEARLRQLEEIQKQLREDRRYTWSPAVNIILWVLSAGLGVLVGRFTGRGSPP